MTGYTIGWKVFQKEVDQLLGTVDIQFTMEYGNLVWLQKHSKVRKQLSQE